MSKYEGYDVAASDQVIKTTVLSVKDVFYTEEEEIPAGLGDEQRDYMLARVKSRVTTYLLDELHKYVKASLVDTLNPNLLQVTAKIYLPYVLDDELRLARQSSNEAIKLASELNSRNIDLLARLHKLESHWLVRLYITVKSWFA